MAELLVIRLGTDDTGPAQWIAVDSNGTRLDAPVSGDLSAAMEAATDRRVIVLLPADDTLLTTVDLPIRSSSRLLAALPYALEEQVADDLEMLHFAAGARDVNGKTPVAVTNRELLAKRLDAISEAGIQPDVVTTELSGLAQIPGTINLLLEGNHIMLSDGAETRVSFRDLGPAEVLSAIGVLGDKLSRKSDDTARHVIVYCDSTAQEKYQKELLLLEQELTSLDIKVFPDGALPRLAVTVATSNVINLLQGEFADEQSYSGLFKPWRIAAMLLLALGVLGLGNSGAAYFQLQKHDDVLQQQVLAEFKESFPWINEVTDPEAQLNSLLRQTGGGGKPQVFLQSLEQLSLALQQNSEATIEAISYRDGVMDIRLTAPNVVTLDKIQQAISSNGQFSASIQSTDQQGNAVKSRIQIQVRAA